MFASGGWCSFTGFGKSVWKLFKWIHSFSARLSPQQNETKTERESEAEIYIWIFLAFNRRFLWSRLQQATDRDRQTDSQTGERGRRREKTITGKQRVLYCYFLFDVHDGMSWAVFKCCLIVFEQRRSLIVITRPLGGINLHYFLNPGVLLS